MNQLTLVPAYGRDYKSKEEVEEAWESGHDFQIATIGYGSRYINKEDALTFTNATSFKIRYNRKQRVHIISLKEV